MVDVVGRDVGSRAQRNDFTGVERARGGAVCARKRTEIVVERPVLLDDEHNVPDLVHASLTFTAPESVLSGIGSLLAPTQPDRDASDDGEADGGCGPVGDSG